MKNSILFTILLVASMLFGLEAKTELVPSIDVKNLNNKMCKVFTKKAKEYEKTMRNDKYAEVTLASYKSRAKIYCVINSNTISK